jgi:hypothetical protein
MRKNLSTADTILRPKKEFFTIKEIQPSKAKVNNKLSKKQRINELNLAVLLLTNLLKKEIFTI